MICLKYSGVSIRVLIETYWNVKENDLVFLKNSFSGINRNILECKAIIGDRTGRIRTRINRNILECKVLLKVAICRAGLCINRNILECKDGRATI